MEAASLEASPRTSLLQPLNLQSDERECLAGVTTSHPLASSHQQCQVQPTNRFDPVPDSRSLSNLRELLEEEDDGAAGGLDRFGELLAYQAKASELAAIVKEDSPALSFKLTFKTPSVMEGGSYGHLQCHPGYNLPKKVLLPAISQVAESCPENIYLASSQGPPRSLAIPLSSLSNEFLPSQDALDVSLFKNVPGRPASTLQAVAGAKSVNRPDTVQSISSARHEKEHWKASVLKPRKEKSAVQKTSKVNKSNPSSDVFIDLNALLLQCAQAVASNNTKAAMQVLIKVKQFSSPHGDGPQRLAYFFAEALEARITGTGWQIYLGHMRQQRPSPKEVLKASCMYMSSCPFAKAFRLFVNQTILDAAKGASTLHIMEYQFTGFQYPSLFQALAARPGGPPLVRLIGGNVPHYSMVSSQMEVLLDRLEQTGRQLKACAESYGVPFHFTAWVGKTGTFKMKEYVNPNRSHDEVLAIISVYPLRYINEDLLSPPQKRLEILKTTCAMNPDVFIRGFVTGSYGTPFFLRRFREALFHFECQYDMLDTFVERENADRLVFENEILGRAVLNIIACEQAHVVEKVQKYNQCRTIAQSVGFEQIPLDQKLKSQIEKVLKGWHRDYMVSEDLGYLLMGWKGRMLHALAAWKSSNR